jgi:antirestriction protein ArdC
MATATTPRKTARRSVTKSPATPKVDAYQVITDRIITLLDQGVAAWRKPWTSASSVPTSLSTGKAYRGINNLLLAITAMEQGYTSKWWGTYEQIAKRGGQVRKGERSTQVVLFTTFQVKDDKDPSKTKTIPSLRLFRVFNAEQADGLVLPTEPVVERTEVEIIAEIEAAIAPYEATLAKITHGGGSAHYVPSTDVLALPVRADFHSTAKYYDARFHELGHSTGHPSRLDREGVTGHSHFGSALYAREELVAQMTAAFVSGHFGLIAETEENSAAYLANWIQVLRNDRKMVVRAAGQAQKAADLILGQAKEETAA